MKVLFLYLKAFSLTGGIEKFNRSFLKALHELSVDGLFDADAISSSDTVNNEKYFPVKRFKGYGGRKIAFVLGTLAKAWQYDTVIIGHINLAIVGNLIKLIKPSVKLILVSHGIEVWKTHKGQKKRLLGQVDAILAVSQFTKERILHHNQFVDAQKIKLFPNTIDPYFIAPQKFGKPAYLLERYGITDGMHVILTITRLSSTEKYKGYDSTITLMKDLKQGSHSILYLLCGKADAVEQERISSLIQEFGVQDRVITTGFLKDEELIDHYLLADAFVMPSKKEGFGIVFIEAMACGSKVIAGNKDGSVDALKNGELGMLIDPDSSEQLQEAIVQTLTMGNHDPLLVQRKVYAAFGFDQYKKRLGKYLSE